MDSIDQRAAGVPLPLTRGEKNAYLVDAIERLHRRCGRIPTIGEARRELQAVLGREIGAKLYPRSTVGVAVASYQSRKGLVRAGKSSGR